MMYPKASIPKSLTPYEARVWYSWRKSKIGSSIDYSIDLETAAREAVDLRNAIRINARDCMIDTDIAGFLKTKEVNKTFHDLYVEKAALYTTPDEIFQAIIASSMKGREGVDILFKIPK